jgi:hypothetical protein
MKHEPEQMQHPVALALARVLASAGTDPAPYRFEAVDLEGGGVQVTFLPHRDDARTALGLQGRMPLSSEEAAIVATANTYIAPVLEETIGTTEVYRIGGDLPALADFEVDNIVRLAAE